MHPFFLYTYITFVHIHLYSMVHAQRFIKMQPRHTKTVSCPVCMHMYIYLRTHTHTHTQIGTSTHLYMYIPSHACIHIYTYISECRCARNIHPHTPLSCITSTRHTRSTVSSPAKTYPHTDTHACTYRSQHVEENHDSPYQHDAKSILSTCTQF